MLNLPRGPGLLATFVLVVIVSLLAQCFPVETERRGKRPARAFKAR